MLKNWQKSRKKMILMPFVKINPDNYRNMCKCLACGVEVEVFESNDYNPPETWHKVEFSVPVVNETGAVIKHGYICPDCFAKMNEPITYSISVNDEVVQPMKTISRFVEKNKSKPEG